MFARVRHLFVLLVLLTASSCNVSPQPVPPPEFAVDALSVAEPAAGTLRLVGATGAVTPGGSRVRVLNVGNVSGIPSRVETTAASDGSFTVEVPGAIGDRLKLTVPQVEEGPPPVLLDTTGGNVVFSPTIECVHLLPDGDYVELPLSPVDFTSSVNVVVDNLCSAPVTVNDANLVLGNGDFALMFTPPASVPAAGATPIVVDYTPSAEGEDEEVLIVEIEQDGQVDFRAVDLFGEGI